jgi:hypothetical protein
VAARHEIVHFRRFIPGIPSLKHPDVEADAIEKKSRLEESVKGN